MSLSLNLSPSDFSILFYKPFKAYGFGAWVLQWLFHEISEEPILLKSIFGGLNLLEIWPEENGTLLYQNSHITSSPLQKTLQKPFLTFNHMGFLQYKLLIELLL